MFTKHYLVLAALGALAVALARARATALAALHRLAASLAVLTRGNVLAVLAGHHVGHFIFLGEIF